MNFVTMDPLQYELNGIASRRRSSKKLPKPSDRDYYIPSK
jgi:hypothetical protein